MNHKKKQYSKDHSQTSRLFLRGVFGLLACVFAFAGPLNAHASSATQVKRALKTKGYHQRIFVTKPLMGDIHTPLAPPRKPEPKHRGFIYAETQKWSKLTQVIARQPETPLGKILTWLYVKSPDSNPPFETVRQFLAQNPSWPSRAILVRNAEKALFQTPNPDAKQKWFANKRANTLEGELWLIEDAKKKGRIQEAANRIRRVWTHYPIPKSDEKAFLKTYGKNLKTSHHWQRMDTLIWERRLREAKRQIKRLPTKMHLLADARLAFSTRARKAQKSYDLVPKSLRNSPGLVYERARWLRRRGKENRAAQSLLNYTGQRPHPHLWWRETSILIREAIKDKRFEQAYALATHMRQNTVARKADAQWMAGWIALEFQKRPQVAAKHFKTLYSIVKTPVSLARGAYWLARAIDAQGGKAEAQNWYTKATLYNTTFYGQLASYKIGQHSLMAAQPEPISPEALKWVQNHEFSEVLRILFHNQEMRLYRLFARAFYNTATTPDQHRAVVAYIANMSLGQSVHLARVMRQQNIHDLGLTYPVPNWIDFQKTPEKALVLSVIRQESNFDTEARSPVGARGLMQIMPRTAKVEARIMKRPLSIYALTHEPNTNVEIGSHYLGRLLEKYDDHPALALAAYNAGPRNVNKWIKTYGDPRTHAIDTITWMESIPFKETRNYVQRILENHYIYQWLLSEISDKRTTKKG